MSTVANKKLDQIRKNLFSSDDQVVLKAVSDVKEHGDHTFIEPLFLILSTHDDSEVHFEISELLKTLKVENAEKELLRLLAEDSDVFNRKYYLSYLWNSGFFPFDAVHIITKYCLEGDFETILEGITVIENMEAPFNKKQLDEAINITKAHLLANPDEDKKELVLSLYGILSDFDKKG